ncbi:MAG: hypothetical protein ACT4P3_15530 [Betaproteobacteria bacterium]
MLRPPASPEALPVSGEIRFARAGGDWKLAARAAPAERGMVAVTVSANDLQGRPIAPPGAPTAVLRMLDMTMTPERVALLRDESGSWHGAAPLSMAGRWLLEVELNGERLNLTFQTAAQ